MEIWHFYLTGGASPMNGVIVAAARLAAAQARLGHAVTIRLVDGSGGGDGLTAAERAGVRVRTAPSASAAVKEARAALAGSRPPDVVHFHEVQRPPHDYLARSFRRQRVPYFVSPQAGLDPTNMRRFAVRKRVYGALVTRRFLRRAGAIVATNELERQVVSDYVGPGTPVQVVPNSLDLDVMRAPVWARQNGRRPRVVTLCRFDVRQKGLDTLADIAAASPDVDYVVHGTQCKNEPQRTEELRRRAPPNFVFAPPVYGNEKLSTLQSADLFVQPSRWEGLSSSLLEAMAVGIPCAVSGYVASTLPFSEENLGLVLDADPKRAADDLRAALHDANRLRAWSERARRYARQTSDPEQVARATLRLYEGALTG